MDGQVALSVAPLQGTKKRMGDSWNERLYISLRPQTNVLTTMGLLANIPCFLQICGIPSSEGLSCCAERDYLREDSECFIDEG